MTTSQFPLRLPTDTYETLRAEAAATGRSVNALVNDIIETHLRETRTTLIDLIGRAANERYAVVLNKLADL